MKSCGLASAIDGTQDDLISCFKEEKMCSRKSFIKNTNAKLK